VKMLYQIRLLCIFQAFYHFLSENGDTLYILRFIYFNIKILMTEHVHRKFTRIYATHFLNHIFNKQSEIRSNLEFCCLIEIKPCLTIKTSYIILNINLSTKTDTETNVRAHDIIINF
jgi:hypothetical protein